MTHVCAPGTHVPSPNCTVMAAVPQWRCDRCGQIFDRTSDAWDRAAARQALMRAPRGVSGLVGNERYFINIDEDETLLIEDRESDRHIVVPKRIMGEIMRLVQRFDDEGAIRE